MRVEKYKLILDVFNCFVKLFIYIALKLYLLIYNLAMCHYLYEYYWWQFMYTYKYYIATIYDANLKKGKRLKKWSHICMR